MKEKNNPKKLEKEIQKNKINDNIIIVLLSIILVIVAILVYIRLF